MDGIIVYGSLLDPESLNDVFGEGAQFTPVRTYGWRRCFNQKADGQDSEGRDIGVLNVVRDSKSWFNGILVTNLSNESVNEYLECESGYELVEVRGSAVKTYAEGRFFDRGEVFSLVSGTRFLEYPRPMPSHARECVDGAAKWGDEFLADFLIETYRR